MGFSWTHPSILGLSFFFKKILYLFLAVLGVHCCVGFSLLVVSWGYPYLCRAGFSLRRLLSLWSMCVAASGTRDQTCVSCTGRCSLSHWTTRRPLGLAVFLLPACVPGLLCDFPHGVHFFRTWPFCLALQGTASIHGFGSAAQFLEIKFYFNTNLFFTEALSETKCLFGKQTLSVCGVNHFDVARSRAGGYSKEVLDGWLPSGRLFGKGWTGRLGLADVSFNIQNG